MATDFYPCKGKMTTARVLRRNPPMIISLSLPLMRTLDHVGEPEKRVTVAKEALKTDPGCIFLAAHAETLHAKIGHLGAAVRAGNELWGPVEFELDGAMSLWEIDSARPYLDALHNLGEALKADCNVSLVRLTFQGLLTKDPDDHYNVDLRIRDLDRVCAVMHEAPAMTM